MKDRILKKVKDFLSAQARIKGPLIVACSGGPDSKALFYLMVECQRFFSYDLVVAHINHGWRKESEEEARILKKEVESLGIAFYQTSLAGCPPKEDVSRETRYQYFQTLQSALSAEAVLLGHQLEDQAETVLKRVLEGASLVSCGGMKPTSYYRGTLKLWRPLLEVSKKEIIEWLENKKISYFLDPTNLSDAYLRGRMRAELLPFLEKSFGKRCRENLFLLGKRAQSLEAYFMRKLGDLWLLIEKKPIIDIKLLFHLDEQELEFLLKKWIQSHHIQLSVAQMALLIEMVLKERVDICLETKHHRIEIKNGTLALKKVESYLNVKGA